METIQYHIQGIKVTVEQLSKGRFWWFFLPGIVITLVYFAALYWTYSTYEQYQFSSENSWIDTFGAHKLLLIHIFIERNQILAPPGREEG